MVYESLPGCWLDTGFVRGLLRAHWSSLCAAESSASDSLLELSLLLLLLGLSLPLNSQQSFFCLLSFSFCLFCPAFLFIFTLPGLSNPLDMGASDICLSCQFGFGKGRSGLFTDSSFGSVLCSLSNFELLDLDRITNQSYEK